MRGWQADLGLLFQGWRHRPGFVIRQTWVCVLALPLSRQEASGNFPNHAEPQFPHLQSGGSKTSLPRWW